MTATTVAAKTWHTVATVADPAWAPLWTVIDDGARPGVTTTESERVKDLEQEVRELRRANEILRRAATFFGAELDRQQRR